MTHWPAFLPLALSNIVRKYVNTYFQLSTACLKHILMLGESFIINFEFNIFCLKQKNDFYQLF